MQKYFSPVSQSRSLPRLLGVIALFAAVAAFFCLETKTDTVISTSVAPTNTLYRQLHEADAVEYPTQEKPSEMNNSSENHANAMPSQESSPTAETGGALCFSGELRVLDAASGTVRRMNLEEYTLCAASAEMPQSFASEALKAQAVACRTLAVYGALVASKHENADICTDFRCCQSFKEISSEDEAYARMREAVRATEGIVAVYGGQPILAAFHAASAVRTRSSAEVWGGALDYLVSVSAVEGEAGSEETFVTSDTVTKALLRHGVREPFVFECNADGLCGGVTDGEGRLSAKELQGLFSLRSDTFTVEISGNGYRFVSLGYGHGVGLSQHGANVLAKRGCDFYEILKYYYTGIGFSFVTQP